MRRYLWTLWCWIMATRPVIPSMASGLVVWSFHLTEQNLENAWLPALQVWVTAAATMVQNNYIDRFHDAKEGRRYALEHPITSLVLAYVWWIAAGVVTVINGISGGWIYLLVGIILYAIGSSYSYLRKYLMVPTLATSLAGAGVISYAWISSPSHWELGWCIPLVVCVLFPRELFKDLKQIVIDRFWKRTIATEFGWEVAQNTAQLVLTISFFLIFAMREHLTPSAWSISLLGTAAVLNLIRYNYKLSYNLTDVGILIPFSLNFLPTTSIPLPHVATVALGVGSRFAPLNPEGPPITNTPIKRWVRPALMGGYVAIIFMMRLAVVLLTTHNLPLAICDGFITTTLCSIGFVILRAIGRPVAKPIENHEQDCEECYLMVKRIAIGMGISSIAVVGMALANIHIAITGSLLAAWATVYDPKLCRILRDRATQLGIFICASICSGIIYAGLGLGIALAIAGIFFYSHQTLRSKFASV